MNLEEVRQQARERLKGICSVCPICDGAACKGRVPGVGGLGTGSSFINNILALREVALNMRVLHDRANPDLRTSVFGREISMPVMGAAIGGAKLNYGGVITEEELASSFVMGCLQSGTMSMTGDGPNPAILSAGLYAIRSAAGAGIVILKPGPNKTVIDKIRLAEDTGAIAVGMDVDAAGLINMVRSGVPVGPKTLEEISEITSSTQLPVILKGIMTADEALIAVEAGARGIVVSNHGGRVLDHTPGVAEVLPDIAEAVKGRITVLADGGVRSGADVLKYLALGADAVLVGRPLAVGAIGGGAEGVRLTLEAIRDDMIRSMVLTGSGSIAEVTLRIIA